jgi:hypothetical protein
MTSVKQKILNLIQSHKRTVVTLGKVSVLGATTTSAIVYYEPWHKYIVYNGYQRAIVKRSDDLFDVIPWYQFNVSIHDLSKYRTDTNQYLVYKYTSREAEFNRLDRLIDQKCKSPKEKNRIRKTIKETSHFKVPDGFDIQL